MGFSNDFLERYKEPEMVMDDKAQDAMFGISEDIRTSGNTMSETPTEPNIIAHVETIKNALEMGGSLKQWFEKNGIYDIEPEEILSAFYLMNLAAEEKTLPTDFLDIVVQNVHATIIVYGLIQSKLTADQITSDQIRQIRLIITWLLYHYNNAPLEAVEEKGVSIRLVDVVKKEDNSGNAFTDINNDLVAYIQDNEDCDPLIKMAYGYARRIAGAGLCLQKIVDKEHYDHVYQVFKSLQLSTDQTEEFQKRAGEQARELIYSYTDLFSKEALQGMVGVVEANNVDFSKSKTGEYIDTQLLANMFKNINI